jgi:hypothetical protein
MRKLSVALGAALDSVADPILRVSLSCLLDHYHPEWGDRAPIDVFTRLLAKNIRPAGWSSVTHIDLRLEQISSRREQWSTAALAALPRGHSDASGIDIACPIVIAEYHGQQRLLDGNHRVNRWERMSDERLHDVNIHSIAGTVRFLDSSLESHGA